MTTDTNEPPKQELLLKLLKMTTSDNDPEALAALRKANALLRSAGWDWDMLIAAKIRIIADPFANLGQPTAGQGRPTRAYTPPQPAPPPPPPVSNTTWPLGIQPNRFASFCYCCGLEVVTNAGVIFKPNKYHSRATADWKVACQNCNVTATVHAAAAPRQRAPKGKRYVSDLA